MGLDGKELHAGICRIMQDYCGEYKAEDTLKMGLRWLDSIRESEAANASAMNPHELMRILESLFSHYCGGDDYARITVTEGQQ